LNFSRAWCALLTCAALCTSSAAYAQARAGASAQSMAAVNSGVSGEPDFEEIAGSNPCHPISIPALRREREINSEVEQYQAAWTRICIESVRSDAVALAWSRGRDEHGEPLDGDVRARQLAETKSWLRRLNGKYRIEGMRWNSTDRKNMLVRGTAECFGIGNGPGVSCVISAGWKSNRETSEQEDQSRDMHSAIRPQVLLFGLDPDTTEILVTHVDAVAVELRGIVLGGAVILNERRPPLVSRRAPINDRNRREDLVALEKGKYRRPALHYYTATLSSLPLDEDGNYPRRLSRIAITRSGDVDVGFHVFSPYDWGERGSQLPIEGLPIEFDVQWHREPQLAAELRSPAVATDFNCAMTIGPGKQQGQDEAGNARAGVRKESSTGEMQSWLARLVGQYSVEGTVDLCGQENPAEQRPVTGKVDCIAAGSPPSVHCNVTVSWPQAIGRNGVPVPGGVSNLAPAQFLFSLFTRERYRFDGVLAGEPTGGVDKRGLHILQLDSQGIAEWASSELVGDTFLARENCLDVPGDCHKITRITARPGSNEISMQVEVEINRKRVLRQTFLLRRETSIQKNEHAGALLP
jgi:hypothetical protein